MSRTERRIGDTTPTAAERTAARADYADMMRHGTRTPGIEYAEMVGYFKSTLRGIADPHVPDHLVTRSIARARALMDAQEEQWEQEG